MKTREAAGYLCDRSQLRLEVHLSSELAQGSSPWSRSTPGKYYLGFCWKFPLGSSKKVLVEILSCGSVNLG